MDGNNPEVCCWFFTDKSYFVYVFLPFFLASTINTFSLISIPFTLGTSTYIVETNFNQDALTGTLNGKGVTNLTNIRVSLAA